MFKEGDLCRIDFSTIESTATLDNTFVMDNSYFFDTSLGFGEHKLILFLETKFMGDILNEDVFQSTVFCVNESCFYHIIFRADIINYTLIGEFDNE